MSVPITKTEEQKLKEGAAKIALAPEGQKRSKCWELFLEILVGEEGASQVRLKVITVIIFELIFVASVMLDAFAGGALHQHGIHPRDFPMGLLGVLFAPFLHKGLGHWLVNAVPFFVLSMLVLLRPSGFTTYFMLWGITTIVTGVLVWVLGAGGTNHIGSSNLLFSFFGYLVTSGIVRKSLRDFLIGAVVFLLYSSLFWGILPVDERVSWEGHLFGVLTGALFGFIDAKLAEREATKEKTREVGNEAEKEKLIP